MTANWFDKSLETQRQDRILKRALLGIYLLILGIVIVGGITRLTNSGLSMVDWRPVTGLLPPMSEASWMEVFDSYQKSPEGSLLNQDMGLREFKWIFFWEYLHRMLGRLVGLVALILFLWSVLALPTGRKHIRRRTGTIALLIGLQGLLGWYMVKSGLTKVPHVSHFRLAAHLCLAFFAAQYTLWTLLDTSANNALLGIPKRDSTKRLHALKHATLLFGALLVLQIV